MKEGGKGLHFRGAELEALKYDILQTDGSFVLQRKSRTSLGVIEI